MKIDEQDDLWELLGKAKAPSPSAFFSRNVLRAIREEKQEKLWLFGWSSWRWVTLGASTCALLVAAGFVFIPTIHSRGQAQSDAAVLVLAQQVSASPDYQVIDHLDELLASEETSVWLDK